MREVVATSSDSWTFLSAIVNELVALPVEMIALAATGLFLAGVVKGATGLGYASCAVPFLVLAFGLEPAMAIVVAPAIATCLSLARAAGSLRETMRSFAPLYMGMAPGIALGVALLLVVGSTVPTRLLAVVMISYGLLSLLKPGFHVTAETGRRLRVPTGFANGVITGLTGSQVMPLLPYVLALRMPSAVTVQVVNLAVAIGSLILAASLLAAGKMTAPLLIGSLAAVPIALLGVAFGDRLRRILPERHGRSAILLVLIAMGVGILMRS